MIEFTREERRRHPRQTVDFPIREAVAGVGRISHAIDLSEWGLRYERLAGGVERSGREVFLEFCLPGETSPIRAFSWVTSEREVGLSLRTSVRFTDMRAVDQERVRAYIWRTRLAA